jgi:hypothetical protein
MQSDPWMFQSMLCFKDQILPCLKNFVFFFFFFIMSVDVYWILGCDNLWHVLKLLSSSSSSLIIMPSDTYWILGCFNFAMLQGLLPLPLPHYHANWCKLDSWIFWPLLCSKTFFFLLIIRIWGILVWKTSNVDSFQTIWRGLNLCLVVWGFVSIDETWILVLWVDSIILMGKFLWFATLFMMFWTAIFLFSLICCFHHHCFVQAWRSCAL